MHKTVLTEKDAIAPLAGIAGVVTAVSGRAHGNMSLSYGDTACSLRNREKFLSLLGMDYRDIVCGCQVHGGAVARVTEHERGKGALTTETAIGDTDALISNCPGLPLAIFTADCATVFVYDTATRAVGLIHAGWRGTKERIAAGTLEAMRAEFGSRPENLRVGLGPCIRPCCYEVGREVADFFPGGVREESGRHFLDLAAVNRQQLLGLGIPAGHIHDSGECTCCGTGEFFSFRREGPATGRMMSVIMVRPS